MDNIMYINGEGVEILPPYDKLSDHWGASMVVYVARNRENGKLYVGITTGTLYERFVSHLRASRKKTRRSAFQLAIANYGFDAFDIAVMTRCDSVEEMCAWEMEWIARLNCIDPRGYNRTIGGDKPPSGVCSDETRKKMRENVRGDKHPMRGRHHTEEARKAISEAIKGDRNPNFGKKASEETRKKNSEANSGERHRMFGKHHTEESKRKLSEAHTGKIVSEQAKQNMRAARLRFLAEKKEKI
jgi:group I intron endonuclease